MPDQQVYEYAFIRYVPRVEREEFLNVGVILFCKGKRFLQMRYQINSRRLQAFSSEINLTELEQYLKAWDIICQGKAQDQPIAQLDPASRFRWLTATRSTIIQSSKVHPGLCSNPESVLEKLFTNYVL
ncbi:DUF3037 domain-containing protein [Tunicatimonas pelagia]|uniref:DUF3037 domain-containing protein n=1 Tax=Tunicatimonas pelagia TaxID=931531 RepID=UPI002665AFE7|nr:DUF3037 domain-containing protein [Tunicatimonas pelagia]WKN43393.1 DUF3037 domain-containing protein [Tunicatimonas pelagia]